MHARNAKRDHTGQTKMEQREERERGETGQEKQRENYLVMKTKKKKTTWRCCFAKYMRTADAKYAQTFAAIYLIQVDKPQLKNIY